MNRNRPLDARAVTWANEATGGDTAGEDMAGDPVHRQRWASAYAAALREQRGGPPTSGAKVGDPARRCAPGMCGT